MSTNPTSEEFDAAPTTVLVAKPGGKRTYEGCPCGSITFDPRHVRDPRDGRIFNRCRQCEGLVRSHYLEIRPEGAAPLFVREEVV